MLMHLTQVPTRCSIGAWNNILRLYLSLKNNLAQKNRVGNIFLRYDGPMVLSVQSVNTIRHGTPEEIYCNAQAVDIKVLSRQEQFSKTRASLYNYGLEPYGMLWDKKMELML